MAKTMKMLEEKREQDLLGGKWTSTPSASYLNREDGAGESSCWASTCKEGWEWVLAIFRSPPKMNVRWILIDCVEIFGRAEGELHVRLYCSRSSIVRLLCMSHEKLC
jgi:hypothetical protein